MCRIMRWPKDENGLEAGKSMNEREMVEKEAQHACCTY